MKTAIKRIISIILITIFFIGPYMGVVNVYADTKKTENADTIKVGFFEMQGFQYYDEVGEPVGYNVEYLNIISDFTGWNYEYVPVDNFSDALTMLENKEIDLVAPVMVTSEWMEKFDFSAFAMGTGYYALVCDANNNELHYEDWDSITNTKVSVAKGYPITESFLEFVAANSIDVEICYYDTTEEAIYAMKKGEVDCSITSLIAVDDSYKVLSKYCSSLMYYITWDGNTELIEELDRAMEYIQSLYSAELENLEKEYFPTYSKQYFAEEEVAFIANSDVIRVAYTSSNVPISYTDKNGNYNGITYGVLERVAVITGLKFEYVEIPNVAIDSDFFVENRIDLIADVENNPINKNLTDYYMSVPYLCSERIFIGRDDTPFNKYSNYKVAIHSGSKTIKEAIKNNYPYLEIVNYNTIDGCFDALAKKKVDFVLGNEYNIEYCMSRPKYAKFTVVPTERISEELCFATHLYDGGMTAEECRILIHIIDKAVAEISVNDIDDITIVKKIESKYEYTFADALYKYRYIISLCGLVIVAVVSVIIYILINTIRRNKMHRDEANNSIIQKKRYQLVADNSEDMIYEIGIVSESNIKSDRIKDLFGWEVPAKLDDYSFDDIMNGLRVHPDDADQLRGQYEHKLDVDGIEKAVVQINSEFEGYIWCELSIMPLKDENNIVISYVGKITNIDEDIKSRQKQGQELNESRVRSENLEEIVINAYADNMTEIIKVNLETGDCIFYVIKDGELVEVPFDEDWDSYNKMFIGTMEQEDANRLLGKTTRARLARLEVGASEVYHYKSKYNTKTRKISRKYYSYTSKIRIAMINGQKVAIISSIDNSDAMKIEQEYIAQKEEFANRVFESQKFLFNAMSGTYLATLKIKIKDGSVRAIVGDEEGVVEERELGVTWDDYCNNELIPYIEEEYQGEFKKAVSMTALKKHKVGAEVKFGFKASLDEETLDPTTDSNYFIINTKILLEGVDKIASIIFQCDSKNVKNEIERFKKKEFNFRKKRIMALLDNTTDIIYEIDLENNECVITGEKNNIYGWNLDVKIENPTMEKLLEIWNVYPEDRYVVGEATQIMLRKKTTVFKDIRVRRADGVYVWSRISAVPVYNEDDKLTNIICKLVNINDKIREKKRYMENEGKDKLTGLLNQSAMMDITETYLHENSAKNDALIIIDMDQLKTVNEVLDHRVGDKVLVETAKKLQIIFSNYDYIGKFESDTFCVFVKNIPMNTLENKLEWALEKLRDTYRYNGKIVEVSACIGVAYCMSEKANYRDLYEFADATVEEAKESGKAQCLIKRFF